MKYNNELSTKNMKEGQNGINYNSIKRAIVKGIATIGIATATIFGPVAVPFFLFAIVTTCSSTLYPLFSFLVLDISVWVNE